MQNLLTNKRALSGIVSTIGLLFVGIIAGSLLAFLLFKSLTPSLSPALSCSQLQLSPPITVQSVCFDEGSSILRATLTSPLTAKNIQFAEFSLAGEKTESWQCGANLCEECILPNPGETKPIVLYHSQAIKEGDIFVLTIGGCAIDRSEILPCSIR